MSINTRISLYRPTVFDDAVDKEIRRSTVLPTPYRPTGLGALFKPTPSLLDDAEWFRQFAEKQRAKKEAVDASLELGRALHRVGRMPVIFAQDDELMHMRFGNERREQELLSLQYDLAEEEIYAKREKFRLSVARDKAEQAKLSGTAHRPTTASGKRFNETLKAREELDRQTQEAIDAVEQSELSKEEKAERIAFIREQHRRATMEDG